jgi:hypothetical protein
LHRLLEALKDTAHILEAEPVTFARSLAARMRTDSNLNKPWKSLQFSVHETHTCWQMGWGFPAGVMASVRSPGPFAFWSRVNLQAPAFKANPRMFAPSAAEELLLEHVECAIGLLWPDH